MKKASLDRQKAGRIYQVKVADVIERHRKEFQELAQDFQKRGLRGQGPEYAALEDLSFKQIKECTGIYVESLLGTIEKNKRVDERMESDLVKIMVDFLEALVARENNKVKTRLAANNITGGLADSHLSVLPRMSLEIRGYYSNKIKVEIDKINEEVIRGLAGFWKSIKSEFTKTGAQKIAALVWNGFFLVIGLFGGWLVRGCFEK